MVKKLILIIIILSFVFSLSELNLFAQQSNTPQKKFLAGTFPLDTSPHGLEVSGRVEVIGSPKVGCTIRVTFRLKNVSTRDITFGPNGVFVGARWNSTTDVNNRDFGHQYRNFTLGVNQTIYIEASRVIDQPGTWRFWPAYNIGRGYGPFRWHEVVVEVSN